MLSLGIDIGYSSIKLALIDKDKSVVRQHYQLHRGKVKETLMEALIELMEDAPGDVAWGAVCGSGAKMLAPVPGLLGINDIQAVVDGVLALNRDVGSIIEIGGQSAKYITDFGGDDQSRIQISMNSSCSAGTGSFLEEQLSRLNLELENYAVYAQRAKSVPRIAGRCSVFAKTDITHHQQQGVPVEDILMGLAYAVIKNYRGSVMKKLPRIKPILFAGGVSQNRAITEVLRDVLRLETDELIVTDQSPVLGALGAASAAMEQGAGFNLNKLWDHLHGIRELNLLTEQGSALPCLASFGPVDNQSQHQIDPQARMREGGSYYLGVDAGSTSTNLVLTDHRDRIVAHRYLRTMGRPAAQVATGLTELKQELGDRINIAGVGVTGSGRYMIAEMIGADTVKDEITAQAKAAVTIDPAIDTIFEIGGQDSKYISLTDGVVIDFQMNKVCAAGTGSFLEEQAKKFDIPVGDLGEIAMFGSRPTNLGERCTVFMETSIAAHLAQGADLDNIAAGLCYSIAKNYLNRVVGTKKIGNRISFQGGVAFNQGVVNAFKSLTGKDVLVPPFFSVTGAMGAAVLAREDAGEAPSKFKGFDVKPPEQATRKPAAVIDSRRHSDTFNRKVNDLVFEGYTPELDSGKKTVGIPRALFCFGMFPMFSTFFRELGFNVLLSDPTNEETIRLAQEYSLDETCYPVKLINGHVAGLVSKKVDYIFFPDLYTVEHPGSHTRQDFGCSYMQLAFKIVKKAMELDRHGIKLLSPTIAFSLGKEFMMKSFAGMGEKLGKSPEEIQKALQAGMMAYKKFEKRLEEQGKQAMASLKPDEKAFVLISKIYGVADPVLNMGIPGKLMDMGYKVLNFYDLPEADLAPAHPNMYWPFGQHILESAQMVKNHPNLYAIYLSHHCCGPDSVMLHFVREIMDGKPYLNIEVDEHSSDVGMITRVEAFVNSLEKIEPVKAESITSYTDQVDCPETNLATRIEKPGNGTTLYLPNLYPYSQVFSAILERQGIKSKVLPLTSDESVDLGRKHTLTSEYLSFTALAGDVLARFGCKDNKPNDYAFLIPQTEGAEADGQYSRLLRTILDEQGRAETGIVTPYLEDALKSSPEQAGLIGLGLLAGDLINLAPLADRPDHLERVLDLIAQGSLRLGNLEIMAERIKENLNAKTWGKTILVLGEPSLIFNDRLNNHRLRKIEEQGHRLILSPMSEYMWLLWKDYAAQNPDQFSRNYQDNLLILEKEIRKISRQLGNYSPFESDLEKLTRSSDNTVGYYAGGNGRYRQAKQLGDLTGIDGIFTISSTYENTGIALGILQRAGRESAPLLNLTFDGNPNESDQAKIDSFIHYL